MTKPTLLDLYCKAGGAGMGYHQAGFMVIGVDHIVQPNYPFEFVRADALDFARAHGRDFDVVHASPPCQAYSIAQTIRGDDSHPDLIGPTRDVLRAVKRPYVIENVPGSPLDRPVVLCGWSLPRPIRQYRHRWFETSHPVAAPAHRAHTVPQTKLGRPAHPDEFLQVVGNFSGVAQARAALDCDWMTRDELREAVPPAYTRFLGRQLLSFLRPETGPRDGLSECEEDRAS